MTQDNIMSIKKGLLFNHWSRKHLLKRINFSFENNQSDKMKPLNRNTKIQLD